MKAAAKQAHQLLVWAQGQQQVQESQTQQL